MPGGGRLKGILDATGRFRQQQLKRGPGLYEEAMDAAREGDATTALELLEQLRLLLDLSEEDFSRMLGQAHSGPPARPLMDYDPDAPVGGKKEEFQEGGSTGNGGDGPRRPRGPRGALLRAAEMFARRQGKVRSPDIVIPEGYDSFYTRNTGDGIEIWGVRPDGSETRVNRFPAGMGGDLETTARFADQMASIYNTGGFSTEPVVPVSLDEVFPPPPPEPPRADVVPITGRELAPEGNRYRSFQEHLQNLLTRGDPDELELADLAYQAETQLEPLEYEALLDDIYDAGLTPRFYRTYAEEQALGPMPPEGYPRPDVEIQMGYDPETGDIPGGLQALGEVLSEMGIQGDMPEEELRRILQGLEAAGLEPQAQFQRRTLDDMLGQIATEVEGMGPGEVDLNEMLGLLREASAGLENDPTMGPIAREIAELTPEQLQADLERILRERGKTPIDLRRLSYDELNTLQKDGTIPSDLADGLMDEMVDLEGEFMDIVADMDGEYPDELHIVPSLEEPETYIMQVHWLDGDRFKYYAFDPMRGPRETDVTDFVTVREEVVTPQPVRRPEPEAPPRYAGMEYGDVGEVHEEIGGMLENLFGDDYDTINFIDEYNLYPDPERPGAWYARDVRFMESDTYKDLGELRDFYIDVEGNITEIPPGGKPRFQEGGSVQLTDEERALLEESKKPTGAGRRERTAREYMQNIARSLYGAIPGIGSHPEGQLIARDVGDRIYQLGALPLAGGASQWWGVNPTTDEFQYAGPLGDYFRNPRPDPAIGYFDMEEYERQLREWEERNQQTGAIPGIIDETMLLPAMPQMVEMMTDLDEMATDPYYEPSIPAPEFALHAAERAEENWNRAIDMLNVDEPEGFVENTLMAGGMMIAQIPLPSSWVSTLKRIPRALMTKGARTAHILDDLLREAPDTGTRLGQWAVNAAAMGPEFLFPTIQPSVANYIGGALFGGGLMTALTPDEEELLRASMPQHYQELIDIMEDPSQPQNERDMARRILKEIYAKRAYDLMQQGSPLPETREAMQRYSESPEFKQAMDLLTQGGPMAGGGKVKKGISRREFLTGLGAAGVGALAAGKAGVRTGAGDVGAEDLATIRQALDEAAPAAARRAQGTSGEPFRRVVENLLEDLNYWKDDPDMIEGVNQDIADFEYIAESLDEGRLDDAVTRYDQLDTAAREMIYDIDPDDQFWARRQLGRGGSDWERLEWDELDVGEQEIILDEAESAYNEGGQQAFDKYVDQIESQYGVEVYAEEIMDHFDFFDEEFAGGGKVKKGITRREFLTGLGAAGAGALAAGKAGVRTGAGDVGAEDLATIRQALDEAAPAAARQLEPFALGDIPDNIRDIVMDEVKIHVDDLFDMIREDPEWAVENAQAYREAETLANITDMSAELDEAQLYALQDVVDYMADDINATNTPEQQQSLNYLRDTIKDSLPVSARSMEEARRIAELQEHPRFAEWTQRLEASAREDFGVATDTLDDIIGEFEAEGLTFDHEQAFYVLADNIDPRFRQ